MERIGGTITVDEEFRLTLSPELCARLQVGPGDTVDMDVHDGHLVIGSAARPLPKLKTVSD